MDINPLALLEVTMGSDPMGTVEDDDECMIIEDACTPGPSSKPVILNDEPMIILDDDADEDISSIEPEILADTGVHFLQQEDPLSLNTVNNNGVISNFPLEWVNRNVKNLETMSPTENEYRKNYYVDIHDVLKERLHCTICQEHVGCFAQLHPSYVEHPLLKVLICQKCRNTYRQLSFPLNRNGKDLRCRWCGKLPGRACGNPLRFCRQCPFGFCEICLYHNVSSLKPRHVDWLCIGCDPRSIWGARCILWALQALMLRYQSGPCVSKEDMSICADQCKKQNEKSKNNNRPSGSGQKHRKILPKQQIQVNGMGTEKVKILQRIYPGKVPNGQIPNTDHLRMVLSTPSGTPPLASGSHIILKRLPQISTNSSNHALPFLVPKVDNRCQFNTNWFCQKVLSYEHDLMNLVTKLRKLREDISSEETIQNITTRVETVTTLLSLNSSLLKDCGKNFIHEWQEKRSRMEIDSLNVNNITPEIIVNDTPILPIQPIPPIPMNHSKKSTGKKRRAPPKKKKVNRTNFPVDKVLIPSTDLLENIIQEQLIVKPCFVKLDRIPDQIVDLVKATGGVTIPDKK